MTLVVGWSPHKQDRGSLHLGALLARSLGTDLRVVIGVPVRWPTPEWGNTDREFERHGREVADRAADDVRALSEELCPDVSVEVVVAQGRSTARILLAQVQEVDAAMVVAGSATYGNYGGVVVSSTVDRLLHSSHVPVAVATRGFRTASDSRVGRVTCAYGGDEASRTTLDLTAAITRDAGAALRVATFGVRGRTMYPAEVLGEDEILRVYVETIAARQERQVAGLVESGGTPIDTSTVIATGNSWDDAMNAIPWDSDEVLVVGSSDAGPVARIFLGSTATKILRASPVPVIVVPDRG